MSAFIPPTQDDAVAFITIRLHANSSISVHGHIANKRLAHQLLDHAKDAIGRQVPDDFDIIVPNRDVDVQPSNNMKEFGDIPPDQRGDP